MAPHIQRTDDSTGRRIRTRRHARKLRLVDLADTTGINISQLSLIERDKVTPLLKHLRSIASALATTVPALLPESDRRTPRVP